MARARSSGSGAVWGMVIFGVAFTVSLGMAIVGWARWNKAETEQTKSVRAMKKYVKGEEAAIVRSLNLGGKSAVGYLLDQNRQMRRMISGDAEMPLDAIIKQKKEDRGVEIALFKEFDRLEAELAAAEEARATAEQNREESRQRATAAELARNNLAGEYADSLARLQNRMDDLKNDFDNYTDAGQEMIQNANHQLSEVRREKDLHIVQLQKQAQNLSGDVKELQDEIKRLTATEVVPSMEDVTLADGQIVSVISEESKVFINLGASEHVLRGMTFEVFDKDKVVRLGDPEEPVMPRGKATIEVIDVGKKTSYAQIVRKNRHTVITEDDQIINLVYDPRAVYRFYVFGDFDIDYTGLPTARGREKIEQKIIRWNGQLAEELNYEVDYLVLGVRPPLPEPLPEDEIDPVKIAARVKQEEAFKTYVNLEGEARKLSILVLNQTRFLDLVGHYER